MTPVAWLPQETGLPWCYRSPKYGILCQIRLTLHRSLPAVPGRSYVPSTSVYPLRGTPGEPAHRTRLDSRRIRCALLLYQQPVTGIIYYIVPAIPGTKGHGFICSFTAGFGSGVAAKPSSSRTSRAACCLLAVRLSEIYQISHPVLRSEEH